MAATFMFEPGWNLIDFIDKRPGDPKQFDPARLRPIPIFYGTPNFPITIVETLNFFSILNLHGGYIYVWAGLKPDWFHWQASRGPKTIRSSPAQTHSHFLWNAKLPYNHCWDTIFFSILNLHGGYIYVWAGLKPELFHWQASRGPKTIRSSPAQTHSHFLWNAKLPYNHCWDISNFFSHFKPPWRLHLCLSRAETWLISLTSVQGLKTIRSSPAQTHSHFLWNAKLP